METYSFSQPVTRPLAMLVTCLPAAVNVGVVTLMPIILDFL
jgi:hypothetical protein